MAMTTVFILLCVAGVVVGQTCKLGTATGCDTSVALGLTNQIVAKLNSMGYAFKQTDPAWVRCSAPCNPFLQSAAADALLSAAKAKNDYITLNSAFRSCAQQYLLLKWRDAGLCGLGLVATPGTSNHEGGRAVDLSAYNYWYSTLTSKGFAQPFPSSDAVHFEYLASSDIASQNLRAFQLLWNENNPNNQITADGTYGPQTANALYNAPCTGWAKPPVNCVFSYTAWSLCTKSCGTGTQSRTLVITTPASNGGTACPTQTTQTQNCNTQVCSTECTVSAWSAYSACSVTCGQGNQTRTRTITNQGSGNCPALSESIPCTGSSTSCNCQVSAWSAWSTCSNSCGDGVESRTRTITVAGTSLGTPCPPLTENRPCSKAAGYGTLASCIDTSRCNGLPYSSRTVNVTFGSATGLCPGPASIRCCTNFRLTNAFANNDNEKYPWQNPALIKLQNVIRYYTEYRTFACTFRGRTPDGTFCGADNPNSEINLVDVAIYFDSANDNHVKASEYLQNVLVASSTLLPHWLTFVLEFRGIAATTAPPNPISGYLPPAPDITASQGACTTPQNAFRGNCIAESECTGATFNGLCPGSSKCCVTETAAAAPAPEFVTTAQFAKLFESISSKRAAAMKPYFNEAISALMQDNPSANVKCHRIAAFAAQIGHESLGLKYFEEIASGAAYEGRTDLGNVRTGDGVRYKGRGPIQLTGRSNYASAGKSTTIGFDLEAVPEKVCFPSMGFKTTVWYWISRNLNRYCSGNYNDFTALTRAINGGTNGIDDRRARWAAAKTLLGCTSTARRQDETEPESVLLTEMGLAGPDATDEDIDLFAAKFCGDNPDSCTAGNSDNGNNDVIFGAIVGSLASAVVILVAALVILRKRNADKNSSSTANPLYVSG